MIAVVIPCYRVRAKILGVIRAIGPEVARVYVVDDKRPERTGAHVEQKISDPRVRVIYHAENQGVGGAVLTGYHHAIEDGAAVLVKLDGDGQMDPLLIPIFVRHILDGTADYVKGNRFFDLKSLRGMPAIRLVGNAGLSFLSKASSGYWNVMDPTNGFTAISASVAALLPSQKINKRYFFESDMLFRLNTYQAVVLDVPMDSKYEDENSSMKIGRIALDFPLLHLNRFCKRIAYNYFLRGFTAASLELLVGAAIFTFGILFGITKWIEAARTQAATPTGTIVIAALGIITGLQLLLSWLNFDVQSVPRRPLTPALGLGKTNLENTIPPKVLHG